MPLILRSVKGSNLTPNEADGNFVYLDDRITSVTDNITAGVGVNSITISGAVLTFHMSDGSLETVTLPASLYTWQPQGEWQPTTAYAVNDTVSYFGSLYLVIFAHTSQSTFDPGANDGSGHFYYALILPDAPVWGQTITTSTYTTLVTDANTYMRFTNAGGCAITIDSSVDYPAWSEMHFRDETGLAAGGISIECPTPGSINPVLLFNNATLCNGGTITVKQVNDTGVWDIMGLLLPVTSTYMPDEGSRTTARKTIVLPSGDTIKVPVVTKIAFIDPYDRYQETAHELDNSENSTRVVHVDRVHPVFPVDRNGVPTEDPPSQDDAQDLFVERIDTWHAVDPFDRYQETQLTLDNATGNDLLPPSFTNHEKKHIYRYYEDPQNPDDDGIWVDAELIDEFSVVDPYDRNQETHYTLNNPTNEEFDAGDLSGQASADDPDITIIVGESEGEGTEDNPVRLDPFQNIVNYSGDIWIVVGFTIVITTHTALVGAGGSDPGTQLVNTSYMTDYASALSFDTTSAAVIRSNGDTFDAEGATWSYSGGGTVTETPDPFTLFPTVTSDSNSFTIVTEDVMVTGGPGLYQDFKIDGNPAFLDTLSVAIDAWGVVADGATYTHASQNMIRSATVAQATWDAPVAPGEQRLFLFGSIITSRTFDFSNINVSYKGGIFKSVASTHSSRGQVITVLCKKQPTA